MTNSDFIRRFPQKSIPLPPSMKKVRKILLIVLILPAALALLFTAAALIRLESNAAPDSIDYDDPESLRDLAWRTEMYLIRANPDPESPARAAALKELEDIALLDVPDREKIRLIRERFPEESFWDDPMRALLRAAEAGDPESQFRLGCFYLRKKTIRHIDFDHALGRSILKSEVQAAKWFRRAALQGHAGAQFYLGRCYLMSGSFPFTMTMTWSPHPVAKNADLPTERQAIRVSREAEEWFRKAGKNENPDALLAWYGPPEKYATAKQCIEAGRAFYRALAEQGDVKAILIVAGSSTGTETDEAAAWYLRAAELGSVAGMRLYADFCEERKRVYDEELADADTIRHWREKALETALKRLDEGSAEDLLNCCFSDSFADRISDYTGGESGEDFANRVLPRLWELVGQGDYEFAPEVIRTLSLRFSRGSAPVSALAPATVYRRFAESGFYPQQRYYAKDLLSGTAEEQAEGVRLLRKLAGFGDPYAQYLLGECLLKGTAAPRDRAEAVGWLRKAAKMREIYAMVLLRDALWSGSPLHWLEAMEWTGRVWCHPEYDSLLEYWANTIVAWLKTLPDMAYALWCKFAVWVL